MFKIIELDKIVSGKNIRNERDEEINDLAKSIEWKEKHRGLEEAKAEQFLWENDRAAVM